MFAYLLTVKAIVKQALRIKNIYVEIKNWTQVDPSPTAPHPQHTHRDPCTHTRIRTHTHTHARTHAHIHSRTHARTLLSLSLSLSLPLSPSLFLPEDSSLFFSIIGHVHFFSRFLIVLFNHWSRTFFSLSRFLIVFFTHWSRTLCVVGDSQVVIAVDVEVLHVPRSPRGDLLVRFELFAPLAPLVNGGVGLLHGRAAIVCHCKEKLKME